MYICVDRHVPHDNKQSTWHRGLHCEPAESSRRPPPGCTRRDLSAVPCMRLEVDLEGWPAPFGGCFAGRETRLFLRPLAAASPAAAFSSACRGTTPESVLALGPASPADYCRALGLEPSFIGLHPEARRRSGPCPCCTPPRGSTAREPLPASRRSSGPWGLASARPGDGGIPIVTCTSSPCSIPR